MLRIRVPVFGEGFACIFVVCLSAMLTMQMNGVGSVVLQVSDGVSNQQRGSWNADHLSKRQQPGTDTTSSPSSAAALVGAEGEMTTNTPEENSGDSRAASVQDYWYVLLVFVIVVVVVFVCFCACFVKKKRQSHQTLRLETGSYQSPSSNPSTRQLSSVDERSSAINRQHTSSSLVDQTSSPGSLSMDPTPIPSPQPSFTSSLRSARSSGGWGSSRKRQRNHSPGHMSSGSEDTIKPSHKSRSALSLGSNASSSRSLGLSGGGMPRVIRTESQSSGERSVRSAPSSHGHSRGPRRAASSTVIKIVPIGGEVDDASLRSASSMMSMASVGSNHSGRSNRSNVSNRSGVLTRSRSSSSPNTRVEVDVKVHLCNEEEREARSEIAAALAESARQLAQSAANFDQEEEEEGRQRRGWYSKSLPRHSHSSLPHRSLLGTTHSLPLHSNKRRLFSSYSSTNLPLPYARDQVYTPNLPSSSGHTLPVASLDHPRHMVSVDHPNSAHHPYEIYRRNSLSQRHHPPPPESPLTLSQQNSRLSSPSQRSLSSNSEYAPGHYHNPQLPIHLRPQRLLSRRVSEPGDGRQGIIYQNQNPPFLNHVHSSRLRGASGSRQPSVANLDFHSPKSQSQKSHVPRLNGITNPSYSSHELRNQLEDAGFRQELLDGTGMRNENGSDSNTSTLCGSSHSSTLDNKNRLSRVSEKSEHNENDEQRLDTNQDDQSSLCDEERVNQVNHNPSTAQEGETSVDPSLVAKQQSHDERYLTLPNHYRKVLIQQSPLSSMATPTADTFPQPEQLAYHQPSPLSPTSSIEQDMVVSPVRQSPPSRRLKPKPLPGPVTESEVKDASKQDKDTVSVGSTLPRSPASSTCLSSQSIQSIQSAMQDEVMAPNQENHQLERQSSLPDVSLHQQQQEASAISSASSSLPPTRSTKTLSLPRSESGLSGGGGSGYAPTGSENSIDNGGVAKKSSSQAQELPTSGGGVAVASLPDTAKSKASSSVKVATATGNSGSGTTVPFTQAQVEVFNHQPNQVNSQLSYPLQKLLAQPLSFDIENDNVDGLLDPQHGVNFHQHGNVYNHLHSHSHSHSNQLYHQHTTASNRTRGGTVPMPADFQQSQRGLHRNQVPHHSLNLDRIRLPNHVVNHVSFNPGGRPVRTSPGLPSISAAVPPPPHFRGITVDIDV